MVSFEDLPAFAFPIISKHFTFTDFANAFNVWRHGKDLKLQQHVLANSDLIPLLKHAVFDPQFQPFIDFAGNFTVLHALC